MTTTTTTITSPQEIRYLDLSSGYFYYSSRILAFVTWLSCGLFGIYILFFYANSLISDSASRWNNVLPNLYIKSHTASTLGIAIHFTAGGIILAMGFLQLLSIIRHHAPRIHRWLGRIYVIAAVLAGIGGLTFIASTGTIGGLVMNIGFGLYGLLMILCALQAYRYARQLKFDNHQAWAIRLFALAIGSWLYRMEYGFWFLMTNKLWHTQTFHGPFDFVMAFFFYLPNLLVAEAYLRGRSTQVGQVSRFIAGTVMNLAGVLLTVATYFFATQYWLPAIWGHGIR
ncbi:TPA: DUF2306 domain-containing protein [Legionella pneumophila]|nr:DUF2306 domain-containing protein [Legionella pneumophila]